MWHLNYLTPEQEQEYLNLIFDKVQQRRDKIKQSQVKSYLSNEKLKEILLSRPKYLYEKKKIKEYKEKIFLSQYDKLMDAKRIKKENRTHEKNNLIEKYKSIYKVFDYSQIIVKDKTISYQIANLIGEKTCIYCNRQYVFTVEENGGQITRPEFDHYLPKSYYPFFALSLYNLIPSCHICNSHCKGDEELPQNMHPYLTNEQDFFKFTYNINGENPSSVQIKNKTKLSKNVQKFLDVFKIQEIYNCHTDLELTELYTFATKYSNTYLQGILSEIESKLNLSQEEAYRILFGTELFEDKNNNRPLSKFKRDILRELGVIK
ncbi:MAG: hypothetical protein LBR60_03820 [Fibrobacter sp.]|jgi:hypothetical protein|nr:hypothetical protein [Fibrobacter sp.]